jgi:hypothetical protein
MSVSISATDIAVAAAVAAAAEIALAVRGAAVLGETGVALLKASATGVARTAGH